MSDKGAEISSRPFEPRRDPSKTGVAGDAPPVLNSGPDHAEGRDQQSAGGDWALMYRRVPPWACEKYVEHGDHAVCEQCQENFRASGSKTEYRDMPPRAKFGRGWFSVGTVHWFEATDATELQSRDGKRILAAAFCGGICDVTIAWAPRARRECDKCIRALRKVGALS